MTIGLILNPWSRSKYQPLPLMQMHYFAIFGTIDASMPPLDETRYRTKGVPEGIELEFASQGESQEIWERFQQGPAWESFSRGSPQLAEATQQSPTCVIVRGQITDSESLEPLADILGVITSLLDAGGIAVYDVLTASWFDSLDWKLSVFEPGVSGLAKLVAVNEEVVGDFDDQVNLAGKGTGQHWIYTRGMRRFARPDVSFKNCPEELKGSCRSIVEFMAYSMMDGAVIPHNKEIHFRELGEELSCVKVHCQLTGDLEDPHFFNFYLNVTLKP